MPIDGIPDVKFRKKRDQLFEFEIIALTELMKRYKNGELTFDITKFHRPQFNMILFIEKGFGRHFIDFKSHDFKTGDLIYVGENQVHAFEDSCETKAMMILFTTEFLMNGMVHKEVRSVNNVLRNMIKAPVMKGAGKSKTIEMLLSILSSESVSGLIKNRMELFRHLFLSLVIKLDSLNEETDVQKSDVGYQKLMNSFDRLLEEKLFSSRDAGEYAGLLGCSYKHLNMICKSLTDKTAKQYIDYCVTLEIKRYLAVTEINVRELCSIFNFDEETNFVKYFKKHSGMSPKKFREQLLK